LFTMLRRYPPALAIAAQTLPFVLMHLPKPPVEAFSSVVAGVALGTMAYRGRSMLGTWLLHFSCAALLDFLVIVWPR
ncbi:MAG: CPBP family intramembrane metalloprotease, partial [Armatimonadetes bacterium]|nr:CPBP family intramembrane metalloprotease [Armatimonadota bacterium]